MAHRILHQISSNVPKSCILKGHIPIRSTSPKSEKHVTCNLAYFGPQSAVIQTTSKYLSRSTPTILQHNDNPNLSGSRKRFYYNEKSVLGDEKEPRAELVHEQVQENASNSLGDNYLSRFEKLLNDSDYPDQSAKECLSNQQLQTTNTRPPGLKLNEEIINILRTRTEHRRLNRHIEFEKVKQLAYKKYKNASRRMNKISQISDTHLYKIDDQINSSTFGDIKNSEMKLYHHINKTLQPSNICPIGQTDKSVYPEQYRLIKIITKTKIELPKIAPTDVPVKMNQSSMRSKYKKPGSLQVNASEQRGESDKFIDQMKMLEPNYEPQKRYKSPNTITHHIYDTKENEKFKSNSNTDLKACQNIISQLKDLNPDYIAPSINKKKLTEAELIESTANVIDDYQNAVLSYRIDMLNDTLYNKIKARHPSYASSTKNKKISSAIPIKIRVGSKSNLQQSSFSSKSHNLSDTKSNPNEKILVPWPSLSDRRKSEIPNPSKYSNLNKTATILHNPMNTNVWKNGKLNLSCASNKPLEVFLPNKRAFSTKAQMKLNISETDKMQKIDKIPMCSRNEKYSISSKDQIYPRNKPKFEFKNMESSKTVPKTISSSFTESTFPSKVKIFGKEVLNGVQCKSRTQMANLTAENLTLIKKTKFIPRTKEVSACTKKNNRIEKAKFSTPINTNEDDSFSIHTTSNILDSSRSFGDIQQKLKSVHPVGNNITTAKIKIPLQKLDTSLLKAPSKSIKIMVNNAKLIKNNDLKYELLNTKLDKTSNNAAVATKKKTYVNMNKTDIKHVQFETNKKSASKKFNLKMQDTGTTKTLRERANRIGKEYINCKRNNEQSPPNPIICNIKEAEKVSPGSKLSSYSAITLKKTSSKSSNIDSNITNNIVGSNGILGTKQSIKNMIIPTKRASKTADSFLLSEEKDIKIKLRKPPQFTLKEIPFLGNPLSQLKIQNSEKLANLKQQDALRISLKRSGTGISNEEINKTVTTKQPTPEKLCIVSEKKYIADTAWEKAKRTCVNLSSNPSEKEYNYATGKSDKRFLATCTNNMVKRKFNMASTMFPMNDNSVMKNNFAPLYRTYCNMYHPTASGVKKVCLKRLKKRPGYDDDFPSASNWKYLKECEISDKLKCTNIDTQLRYKSKKVKLPRLKRSNCPCVEEMDVDSIHGKLTKGPAFRKGYICDDGKCVESLENVCIETERADFIAGVAVIKKKLPVIYPRTSKFTTCIKKKLLSDDTCSSMSCNKSMHTTILSYRQCTKNNNKLEEKYNVHVKSNKMICTNLQNDSDKSEMYCPEYTTDTKLIYTKAALSPYISYSEYKISKPQLEPPLLDSEETPDYLQPKCSMLNPFFSLEPSVPKDINIDVRHEENFTKIIKPNIKDLNKFATVTATEVQCKNSQVEESHNPTAKNLSCPPWSLKTKKTNESSSSAIGIPSELAFKNTKPLRQDDKEKHSDTSLEHQMELVKGICKNSIPISDLLNSSSEGDFEQNLKSSLNQFADELTSSAVEIKYNDSIRNVCKETETALFDHANSKCELNPVTKDLSEPCSKAIIPCDVSLHKECQKIQVPSLWGRITNYIKAKLVYTDMQQKKIETDLLLCSGDENRKSNSKDSTKIQFNASNDMINDKHMVQVEISKCDHSSKKCLNGNDDGESPEVKWTSANPFQILSKECNSFLQTIKEGENASKTKLINNYEFDRKPLKPYTEDSTRLLTNRRAFSTFSFQSRAYSGRSPKTPTDLLEYFNKIQNEKTSNIDEDELTNNILTAIKVGMAVIKKSKLPNFNDCYFDLFKQLDTISKVELQSIQSNKDDRCEVISWPTEDKAYLQDKKRIHVANTMQQFCKNGCDIQNYTVLDYEESERKKTDDLKQILDEILKRSAEA